MTEWVVIRTEPTWNPNITKVIYEEATEDECEIWGLIPTTAEAARFRDIPDCYGEKSPAWTGGYISGFVPHTLHGNMSETARSEQMMGAYHGRRDCKGT